MGTPRTLFVGDVHGCARELEALLFRAHPTRVILVGDLFTKGPDAAGVWDLIRAFDAEAVLGNHDQRVLDEWRRGRDLPRSAFRWLRDLPWMVMDRSWLAVHAAVQPARWRKTRRPQAIGVEALPRWWEGYRGTRLVVHGHNSRMGLMDRRPYTLGLDTGCVKGGRLTGYLLEEDRLLSVAARRAYA